MNKGIKQIPCQNSMRRRFWAGLLIAIVIAPIGISCYVGPDITCWDFETIEDASRKVGIDLFIIPSTEWNYYSGIQDLEDRNYRIYECSWRKGSKEWVIYKREGGSYYCYRFSGPEFSRWDFRTIEEASLKVERDLSQVQATQWNDCNFILNLTNGCNYRVYECFWRKRAEEWIICKQDGEKYSWYSFLKPATPP